MSSPRKSYGPNEIREGTRFVLKEITASLNNSQTSPRKSGNDSALQKSPEHAVKVQFAREFADVKKTTSPTTESLSSAGSFQSLSSTLSSKSSSGICADHQPVSPGKSANTSYINSDIPGLDDLISACADIKLNEHVQFGIGDLSQDQTFSSACGDLSIIEEIETKEVHVKEENYFKENNNLNKGNLPPEDFLPPPEQFPIQSFSSNAPFVSFNDTIANTHGLNNINKDSLVFSTALDFQNLAALVPKIDVDIKPIIESNNSQTEEHVNSITEFGFNASIESQKNVSLIESNKNISTLETSQLPLIQNILNLTTPSDNNSVNNESSQLETIDSIKVSVENLNNSVKNLEEIPVIFEESVKLTEEEIPIISEQSIKVETEEIPVNSEKFVILQQVPIISEESIKPTEEIPINTEQIIKVGTEKLQVNSENCVKPTEEVPVISEESVKLTEEIPINTEQILKVETEKLQVDSENSVKPTEEVPVTSEESIKLTEEIPINTEQILKFAEEIPEIDSENCVKPTEEIPVNLEQNTEILNNSEQSVNFVEKVSDNSNNIDLNSTFPITPNNSLKDISQELKSPILEFHDKVAVTPVSQEHNIHSPIDETIEKISNFEPEKKKSPILQSILDKVAEQQKSLDDIYTGEISKNLNLENSPEECKRNFNLSTIIESPPDLESPQEKKFLNNTIALSLEKSQKNNSNSLEKTNSNETVDSSSEIVFLKQSTLESTVLTVNGNQQESAKRKAPLHDKSYEDCAQLKNSLNLADKKEESPAEVIKKESQFELGQTETPKRPTKRSKIQETVKKIQEDIKKIEITKLNESSVPVELDSTIILESSEIDLEAPDPIVPQEDNYDTFKPQKQSTDLTNIANFSLFEKVELEAQAVAQDIYNKSLEIVDDTDHFISATSELFQDPTSFDFLLNQGSSNTKTRDLRFESLYVKFDPLVNNSMLPQGNSQTENEVQNEKNEMPSVPCADTPMRNPAIAAIDRLLFYSPITTGNKTEATKDIKKETTETAPPEIPIVDEKMAKELELVRSLLVQHEEKLEKNEKEREEDKRKYQKDLKKQQEEYKKLEDKCIHLEIQLAEELESKKQMTVVLDEYEKSISRMVAEKEKRDLTEFEEKERLKDDLQTAHQHLNNTEAAFNGIHQKYERAKNVVAAYKSNELILKESHKENLETIAMLEKKYETLKVHAMAQLENANHELETIRKHNDSENVKLQAMLKKTELKCKSLADQVEQKTKENKELTKILDEVIARVGNENQD